MLLWGRIFDKELERKDAGTAAAAGTSGDGGEAAAIDQR